MGAALLLLLAVGAALLLLAADGRGAALHLTESIETKCKDLVVTFFVRVSRFYTSKAFTCVPAVLQFYWSNFIRTSPIGLHIHDLTDKGEWLCVSVCVCVFVCVCCQLC